MTKCQNCGAEDWPDYGVENGIWTELASKGVFCLNCIGSMFQQEYGVAGATGIGVPLVVYIAGVTIERAKRKAPKRGATGPSY